jgi:hypothetical protein
MEAGGKDMNIPGRSKKVLKNSTWKKGLNRELNPGPPPIPVNPKKESYY